MADEKKLNPAENAEKKPAAAKKTVAKKTAEKKASAKPAAEKKTAKAAAKKAPAEKKTRRSKAAAEEAVLSPLDVITTAIWKNIEKKKVDHITSPIAIQVNVHDAGTFYIAVKANPDEDKQVMQSDYYLADGILETSADEIKKIAAGKYDYAAAAKAGALTYRGDLTKGILVAELLK
ncbi:MAG: hypothetical protein K2N36_07140 [Ruminiclostridium sp.]|nr:hypothetical protein [Ruminiclostridium sp.]